MFFSKDTYSFVDSYHYEGKSLIAKYFDFVSSPWCELKGGKTISISKDSISTEYTDKKILALKIGALALSILILPKIGGLVALTTLATCALKPLFVKYSGEIEKIDLQFQKREEQGAIDRFEKEKEGKYFWRLIKPFKEYPCLRQSVENQRAFAKGVIEDNESLDKAADLFSLISDKDVLSEAITEMYSKYLKAYESHVICFDFNYDYSFTSLEDFIKKALGDKSKDVGDAVMETSSLAILEKFKITEKITLSHSFGWDLLKILIIEDALALLKKENERSQRLALVEGFNPNIPKFRKFVKALFDLKVQAEILNRYNTKNPKLFEQKIKEAIDILHTK